MPQSNPYTLEICVETAQGLDACLGLADRIELCAALDVGGVTPSAGLMKAALDARLETHVLIRPRSGDFTLSDHDLKVAISDIDYVRSIGLSGVVIGAARDGALDIKALTEMTKAAAGLEITLHRAFDVVHYQDRALAQAIDLGFQRILTSGGAKDALSGAEQLSHLNRLANGRIELMAGAGITSQNVRQIANVTGVTAFHASCSSKESLEKSFSDKGFGSFARTTDRQEITKMRQHLDAFFA